MRILHKARATTAGLTLKIQPTAKAISAITDVMTRNPRA
jgi:hypothetical protein